MSANQQFACGAVSKEQAVLDAERMVKFAAEPVVPGELVKGQIRNASNALQLDFGTVRRAWYRLSGPEIYPTIYNAWAALIERLATQMRRRQSSPWRGDVHLPGVLSDGNANQEIRGSWPTVRTRAEILRVMPKSPRQRPSPKKMRA